MHTHRLTPDLAVLADQIAIPGIGHLPVNAFVLLAGAPVVVDAGLGLPDNGFLEALGSVVDPSDIEWIWLTHPDRDHSGSLFALLDAAPNARVITTFAGVGIMSAATPLPIQRVYLLNPGQSLDVGDRRLTAVRPPLFDDPSTTGLYDDRSGALFTSDCLGAVLPSAELATADGVRYLPAADLRDAQHRWAAMNSPWMHLVDKAKYLVALSSLQALSPKWILSTHLPAASGLTTAFLDTLATAPDADQIGRAHV